MAISDICAEEIIDKNYEAIYKFCCARCRNKEMAEDITQETFTIFYGKRNELVDGNIRSYLFTTANLLLKSHFRRLKKEESFVELEDCQFVTYDEYFTDNMTEEEFEELLNDTQKKILSILKPSEREIFIKLYIEKKSITLVSEETGFTENNVRVKSHRIRKKAKGVISSTELLTLVILFKLFH